MLLAHGGAGGAAAEIGAVLVPLVILVLLVWKARITERGDAEESPSDEPAE